MPIKRVADSIEKTPKKPSTIPELPYKGDVIFDYNSASDAMKAAKREQDKVKPDLTEDGLRTLFELNVKRQHAGQEALSSVLLVDETESKLRVTLQDKYSVSDDVAALEKAFKACGSDAGNYVTQGLALKFNSSVFNHPETGDFDEAIYRRFERALKRVTKLVEEELRAEGANVTLPAPFEVVPTYFVKPEFHTNRFKEFSVAQNVELHKLVTATVQLTPTQTGIKPAPVETAKR